MIGLVVGYIQLVAVIKVWMFIIHFVIFFFFLEGRRLQWGKLVLDLVRESFENYIFEIVKIQFDGNY